MNLLEQSKIVVLHAGASKVRKLWSNQKWIKLIAYLQEKDFSPVLIGEGKMDLTTNGNINKALHTPIPNLTNQLDLIDLSRLLKKSSFYIGNDSGPMHLATALDVPAIAIFGPTNESIWGPLLNSTSVMRGYRCPSQCRNGHDCELEFRCLGDLSPERVIKEFMSRVQAPP